MLKRLFISFLILSAILFPFTATTIVHAKESTQSEDSDYIVESRCDNFLGFTSWDCHVNIKKDKDSLKSGVWMIAANLFTDLTVAASYLILGFVIYGGYLYTMSGGDSAKVASGKKTLTNAFIGLAIVLLSNIILNSIRIALGGANLGEDCARGQCIDNPTTMVAGAIQWVVGMVGIVAAVFIVLGGIQYSTSSGDPAKVKKAKETILYALIGLIIVALAEIITGFVANTINKAKTDSSINQSIIIAKEIHEINHI